MDLLEKIKLNYSKEYLEKILIREQKHINIKTLELVTKSTTVKKINLEGSSKVDEQNFYEVYFKYIEDNKSFTLEENINYITTEGVLIYEKDLSEWRLYFYNGNNEKFICKPLREYFKPNLIEYTSKKVDVDFNETCWECGNELINGRCNICNCSDEI